jgi:hypothetical protein
LAQAVKQQLGGGGAAAAAAAVESCELFTSQAVEFIEELKAIKTDKLGPETLHRLTHLFSLL